MINPINISTKIREIRKKNGLSQKEFAEKIGIAQTYLSQIELGNKEVTHKVITNIMLKFDISPNWIYGYNESSKKPDKEDIEEIKNIIKAFQNKLEGFGT